MAAMYFVFSVNYFFVIDLYITCCMSMYLSECWKKVYLYQLL